MIVAISATRDLSQQEYTMAAMRYRTLGRSGLKVSELCLGTMTWGQQNTEAEAHEQLDFAIEKGINFIGVFFKVD